MSPEAQRIAIAEACGWMRDERCDCWRKPIEGPYATAFMNGSHSHRQLPDYLNDLNAMHEAEKVLIGDHEAAFRGWLWLAHGQPELRCAIVHATAAQRAESFLRTFGKWEADK